MSKTAHILAFKADTVEELDFGLTSDAALVHRLLTESDPWVGPRPKLEEDEGFVQLIPYMVLTSGPRWLSYQRGGAGGEHRLDAKRSVGFGGHVDLTDVRTAADGSIDVLTTLNEAACRELLEEVGCTFTGLPMNWTHAISLNATPVDSVHLGLVLFIDMGSMAPHFEDTVTNVEWLEPGELVQRDDLENWTALLAREAIGLEGI